MKPQEVILIGAGGHALSLCEFASHMISGYIDMNENPDIPGDWLGSDQQAAEKFKSRDLKEGVSFHMAFVYSKWPLMTKRRELLDFYKSLGAKFVSLIAPSAIITPGSHIGDGSAIMAGAIINRASIGENVIINSGAIVEHNSRVGQNSFIGPGAVIGGFTEIGDNCFIGLGARVANGIKIESNISIAMGAIVNHNLSEPGFYHGTPLKLTKLKD